MKKTLFAAALALASTAAFARTDALSLVPKDAVTVGVVHINQIRSSPLSSALFQNTDKVSANGEADRFLTEAGLDLGKDIDVVVVATSPRTSLGHEADVVVLAEGRFNVDRLTTALVSRGAVKKNAYLMLPNSEKSGAVAFPDSHLAIVGNEEAVTEALATRAAGGSGFAAAGLLGGYLTRIDPNATAWALVDVARASRLTSAPHVSERHTDGPHEALASAIKSVTTMGVWATDTGDALKLGAFGMANDTETLQLVEDTVRGALSAMRLTVKDKSPDMVSVLRRFDVERTTDSVRVTGTIPGNDLRKLIAKQRAEER
ncbi:MAG TPA: hypothetical protein VLU46_01365 [Thermoanaerobaculia bacterium]|nr:hypothetical protein [Thermoanaerobaculia bacterium]